MKAYYLLHPCGDLTPDDLLYKVPEGQIRHIDGRPLPDGFVYVTKCPDGAGPCSAVPEEDLRSVLDEGDGTHPNQTGPWT